MIEETLGPWDEILNSLGRKFKFLRSTISENFILFQFYSRKIMINDLDEDDMLMQSAIAGDSLRLNTYLKSKFYQVREGDCHTSIHCPQKVFPLQNF